MELRLEEGQAYSTQVLSKLKETELDNNEICGNLTEWNNDLTSAGYFSYQRQSAPLLCLRGRTSICYSGTK